MVMDVEFGVRSQLRPSPLVLVRVGVADLGCGAGDAAALCELSIRSIPAKDVSIGQPTGTKGTLTSTTRRTSHLLHSGLGLINFRRTKTYWGRP